MRRVARGGATRNSFAGVGGIHDGAMRGFTVEARLHLHGASPTRWLSITSGGHYAMASYLALKLF